MLIVIFVIGFTSCKQSNKEQEIPLLIYPNSEREFTEIKIDPLSSKETKLSEFAESIRNY